MEAATKTSLVFSGFNDTSSGGLVRILNEFAERGVNLSKIESRPERTELGVYLFFADLDGGEEDDAVASSIEGVRQKVRNLRVLGLNRLIRLYTANCSDGQQGGATLEQ
jgi:prephenate dehydratase